MRQQDRNKPFRLPFGEDNDKLFVSADIKLIRPFDCVEVDEVIYYIGFNAK